MNRTKKWLAALLLTPFILFTLIAVLLYVPPVQRWAVKQAASYVSENTPWKASVGNVRLVFPLDLGVNNVVLLKANDSIPHNIDTVAVVSQIVADVRLLPLFGGNVVIDQLKVKDADIYTSDLVAAATVKGHIGLLSLKSRGINLNNETVNIDEALLRNSQLQVALHDSVPEDTTSTPTYWKINLDRLNIWNTTATVSLPGDTLRARVALGFAAADKGVFDLGKNDYSLRRIDITRSAVNYDNRLMKPATGGIDANHLALTDVALGIDSLHYVGSNLDLAVRKCQMKEKCGIAVASAAGHVAMDSVSLSLPNFALATKNSNVKASLAMDLNAFADTLPGKIDASLQGTIGIKDVVAAVPDLPKNIVNRLPDIGVDVHFKGNMQSAQIPVFKLSLPSVLNLSANGQLHHLLDFDRLRGNINLSASAGNIDFVRSALPRDVASQFRLPSGMRLDGKIGLDGARYSTSLRLRQGGGSASLVGNINTKSMAYSGKLDVSALNLAHFVPDMGLGVFSGALNVVGNGTDIFSPSTSIQASAGVSQLRFSGNNFAGLKAELKLKNGRAYADVTNHSDLFTGNIKLDALLKKSKIMDANVECDLTDANLMKLGVTSNPLNVGMKARLALESDLDEYYKVNGVVNEITVRDSARTYHPDNIYANVLTRRDTTYAHLTCGDFLLRLNAHGGYKRLMRHADDLMAEAKSQAEHRVIDQLKLRSLLPDMSLVVSAGKDNAFCRALNHFDVKMANAYIDMATSPTAGINGILKLDSLVAQGIQLDTIRLNLKSDSVKTDFQGQICNNKNNPQYVFNAMFGGTFYERGVYMGTRVFDANNKLGVGMGLKASMEDNGIKLSVGGRQDPVLGYKKFSVNKDNYIMLTDDQRVTANLKLTASDGMGLQVYSNDSTEALQDLTLGLTKFELSNVLTILPYLPRISGVMNGDFHVVKTADALTVSSSVSIDDMVYEGSKMGNIASEFVYMPQDDGTHVVDGTLACNGYDVGAISGSYNSEGEGSLDASLQLNHTPLKLLNGFMTDQIVALKGYCDGTLDVKGSLTKPQVNGTVTFDSAYIASEPYGVELQFATTPVKITNSRLAFDNFQMYAHNNTPLTITGYLDFADLDNMYLNTRVSAQNYLLIDSKENARSEAYGKAYVNFNGIMRGPLMSLALSGKLDVLGTTDMTYILRDSPLTTDTQLDDLVKFTNFNSKEEVQVERPELTGIDIDLTISIDDGAHIVCALNTDHSNYVDLIGGGDLRMQYNAVDDLRLTGRYTLTNGEMKYSLPVIPLKTFTIQDGSYVEFTGDAMNPRLNITATEQTKASVSTDGGSGRTVMFNCGVEITKTLQDMGLEFIIDAPEDLTVHNELQTMTAENRGKLAVTMLTTGMYLADGNTSSFSMNSALTAFLNSQINSISGSALRTLDLSFGMDNSTDGTGASHTDYSFKFSKRFWNNRLSIVVGGKVSSGSDASTTQSNNTFFDNVAFEYRLSQNSNKYLKLFYDRDSYDWLEGYVGQYGAGFMYRRKLQRLTDLFNFKRKKSSAAPQQESDSTKVQTAQ